MGDNKGIEMVFPETFTLRLGPLDIFVNIDREGYLSLTTQWFHPEENGLYTMMSFVTLGKEDEFVPKLKYLFERAREETKNFDYEFLISDDRLATIKTIDGVNYYK